MDEHGDRLGVGPGEGAVVAWYASKIAIARITVPYGDGAPPPRRARSSTAGSRGTSSTSRSTSNSPGSTCPPRRLATTPSSSAAPGSTPSAGSRPRTRSASSSPIRRPTKRDALIDQLLGRPEFADYWTYKWSDVLMLTSTRLLPQSIKSYYQWLREHVEANTPWDRLVREILVATGESLENGATNFYALSQSPEEMTENASQAFLGPLDRLRPLPQPPARKMDQRPVLRDGQPVRPGEGQGLGRRRQLGRRPADALRRAVGRPDPAEDRQAAAADPARRPSPCRSTTPRTAGSSLAEWLTAPENPYFARAITNRVWANFFGVGLVEKVDDVRVSNPSSNEALLKAAADDLVRNKFDLKSLMRAILQSNAYQRSSRPLPGNRGEHRFYSRYYPRRMMAEVLHDAIVQVTQVPSKFEFVVVPGGFPAEDRLLSLGDPGDPALRLVGRELFPPVVRPEPPADRLRVRPVGRAVDRPGPPPLQRRHPEREAEGAGEPGREADQPPPPGDVRRLDDRRGLPRLRSAATRPSRNAHRLIALLPAPGSADERPVVEDVFWGLLSSREFLFNH